MKNYDIITVPNPKLLEVTDKVTSFDNEIDTQIKKMVKVLREEGGIGLAANQLGYKNRVITIEFDETDKNNKVKERIPLTIFINPQIVEHSLEEECFEEGCLSVPKIELEISRPAKLKVKYQDEQGRKFKIAPKGLLARILQHEIDHLNGIIFTERAKTQFFQKFPEFKNFKIAFFGSGELGAIILEGLILLGLNLDIYTEKAKPAGRDRKTKPTAVAQVAKKFGKKYVGINHSRSEPNALESNLHRPSRTVKGEVEHVGCDFLTGEIDSRYLLTGIGERQYDLIICADFGQKIPKSILKRAKITAFNIHPSLLPKYIGPTPIQTAILNGDKTTGVSIIKMTDKIDEGPVYTQSEIDISETDNYLVLRDRLATLGLKVLVEILPKIVKNEIVLVDQDLSKKIVTKKISKADGKINWQKSPKKISNQIRAFSPWPGSYTFIDEKRLIIHEAHLKNSKLVLDLVQLEGKKPMKFSEFLRGLHGPKPEWLSKILLT